MRQISECKCKALNIGVLGLIHSTAIVSGSAQLGSGVEIGAYSIIGDNVIIGGDLTPVF